MDAAEGTRRDPMRPRWGAPGGLTAAALAWAAVGWFGGWFGGPGLSVGVVIEVDPLAIALGVGIALSLVAEASGWLLRRGPVRLLRAGALIGVAGLLALVTDGLAELGAALIGLSGAVSVLATWTLLAGSAARMSMVTAVSSVAGLLAPLVLITLDLLDRWVPLAVLNPIALLVVLAPMAPLLVLAVLPVRSAGAAPHHEPVVGTADRVAVLPVVLAWTAVVLAVAVEFYFVISSTFYLRGGGMSAVLSAVVAFPLGMVVGRTLGARMRPVPAAVTRRRLRWAATVTAAATVVVALDPGVVGVALGLGVAGLGLSLAYPLSYSLLVGVPGLTVRRSAAFGAGASGVAILAMPAALFLLWFAGAWRWMLLLPLLLLGLLVLVTIPGTTPQVGAPTAPDPGLPPLPAAAP